ncbi:hypothetical protein HMPREF0868_0694 [Mageeibacillus indolicus UPII9-5]|uniref:Uncharacterized protein n=1 Tax=Mageeibacillus indolicus (strain UPII9-5) TaxID=699246 RepID=D3R1F8_MAGIU|nr:hypothetical protein HMPREF0868_0694 [Mageeibacillus indolicus UPII9-5]
MAKTISPQCHQYGSISSVGIRLNRVSSIANFTFIFDMSGIRTDKGRSMERL